MEQFSELSNRFDWNKDLPVPIVASYHGTDFPVAEKIAQTGFAALSLLDSGYFGKGI